MSVYDDLDLDRFSSQFSLGNRVKLITMASNGSLSSQPDVIWNLANNPNLSDDDIVDQSGQLGGMMQADTLASQMRSLSPATQRAVMRNLSPVQVASLQGIGFRVPEADDGGWHLFDPVQKVGGVVLGGLYKPFSPVIEGAIDALTWTADRPFHLYRTLRTMDANDLLVAGGAVLGAAAGIALAPVTGGGSLFMTGAALSGGALLGATAGGLASNPSDWLRAFGASYDGERTFKLDNQKRADDLLGDPRLRGFASDMARNGLDPAQLARELASTRQNGQNVIGAQLPMLQQMISRLAPQGTPAYEEMMLQATNLLAEPLFQEAVFELRKGKISPGRDVAGALGLEYGSQWYNIVSGTVDGAAQVFLDPTLLIGAAFKTAKLARAGLRVTDMASFGHDTLRATKWMQSIQDSNAGVRRLHEVAAQSIATRDYNLIRRVSPSMARMYNDLRVFHDKGIELGLMQKGVFTLDDLNEYMIVQSKMAGLLSGQGTVRGLRGTPTLEELGRTREALATFRGNIRAFTYGVTDVDFERKLLAQLEDPANIELRRVMPPDIYGVVDKHGLIENQWRYNEHYQGARQLGRQLGSVPVLGSAVARPVAEVVTRMTTMLPKRRVITLEGDDMAEDLRALSEMAMQTGMPEWLRRARFDEMVNGSNMALRANAVTSFLDDALTIGGLRYNAAGSRIADDLLARAKHVYGAGDVTGRRLPSGRPSKASLYPTDMATMIPIPSLFDLRRAVQMNHIGELINGVEGSHVNALMSRVWKPAVLMRFGFAFRAGGEEVFNFMLRGGIGSIGQHLGGASVARVEAYQQAVKRLTAAGGRWDKIDDVTKMLIERGPYQAHLTPIMRTMDRYNWTKPIFAWRETYSNFLEDTLRSGLLDGKFAAPKINESLQGLALKDRSIQNIRNNLSVLAFGSRYSWRRMALGGVDDSLLRSMREMEVRWASTMADQLSARNNAQYENFWDQRERQVVWETDAEDGLVPVPHVIDHSRYDVKVAGEDGAAAARHANMRKWSEDPVLAEAVGSVLPRVVPPQLYGTQMADLLDDYQALAPELREIVALFGVEPRPELVKVAIRELDLHPDLKQYLESHVLDSVPPSLDDLIDALENYSPKGLEAEFQFNRLSANGQSLRSVSAQLNTLDDRGRAAAVQLMDYSIMPSGQVRVVPNDIRAQFDETGEYVGYHQPESVESIDIYDPAQFEVLADGTLRLHLRPMDPNAQHGAIVFGGGAVPTEARTRAVPMRIDIDRQALLDDVGMEAPTALDDMEMLGVARRGAYVTPDGQLAVRVMNEKNHLVTEDEVTAVRDAIRPYLIGQAEGTQRVRSANEMRKRIDKLVPAWVPQSVKDDVAELAWLAHPNSEMNKLRQQTIDLQGDPGTVEPMPSEFLARRAKIGEQFSELVDRYVKAGDRVEQALTRIPNTMPLLGDANRFIDIPANRWRGQVSPDAPVGRKMVNDAYKHARIVDDTLQEAEPEALIAAMLDHWLVNDTVVNDLAQIVGADVVAELRRRVGEMSYPSALGVDSPLTELFKGDNYRLNMVNWLHDTWLTRTGRSADELEVALRQPFIVAMNDLGVQLTDLQFDRLMLRFQTMTGFRTAQMPEGGNPLTWLSEMRQARKTEFGVNNVGRMRNPKVLYESYEEAEPVLLQRVAVGIQKPRANGWALRSQGFDDASAALGRSEATERVFVIPRRTAPLDPTKVDATVDELIWSSVDQQLARDNEDVIRAWLTSDEPLAMEDLAVAMLISNFKMADKVGVREMVVGRDELKNLFRQDARFAPSVRRTIGRTDTPVAWKIRDFDEQAEMLRAIDEPELNAAMEHARRLTFDMRNELTAGTQRVFRVSGRPVSRPYPDKTTGTGGAVATADEELESWIYLGPPDAGLKIPAGKEFGIGDKTSLFDAQGKPVKIGDPRYFDDATVAQGVEGEVLWEAVGPIVQDWLDEAYGRLKFDRRQLTALHAKDMPDNLTPQIREELARAQANIPEDQRIELPPMILQDEQIRIFRAHPQHLDRIPSTEANNRWTAYAPSRHRLEKDSLLQRTFRFGFDQVISPMIDGIARKPMARFFFHQRYEAAMAASRWRVDPTIREQIDMLIAGRSKLAGDPQVLNDTLRDVRRIAYFHGEQAAASWTNAHAAAWLRGHSADEIADLIRRTDVAATTRLATAEKGSPAYVAAREAEVASKQLARRDLDSLRRIEADNMDMEGFIAMVESEVGRATGVDGIPTWDVFSTYYKNKVESGNILHAFKREEWDLLHAAHTNLRHISEEAGEFAAVAAINDMLPFLDSHEFRTQFAETAKPFLPFFYAEENFLKRWARTFILDPTALEKARLGIMGLRQAGVIRDDSQGRGWFVYPGGQLFADMLDKVPGINRLPVEVVFQTPIDNMLPGVSENFGRPGFSPFVTVPTGFLSMGFPEFEPMDRVLAGDYGSSVNPVFQLLPAYARNFVSAAFGNESSRMMSAQMNAMAQLELEGKGLPANATPGQVDAYLDMVREHAKIITVSQALLGYFTPGSPSAMISEDGVTLGIGAVNPKELLSDTYQRLITDLGIEQGTIQYLKLYPLHGLKDILNPIAATESQTESVSGARLPSTEESLSFYMDNLAYMEEFPDAGPWLLPQVNTVGHRSQYAVDQQTILGLRQRKSPEEFLRGLKFKQAAGEYFDERRRYLDAVDQLREAGDRTAVARANDQWEAWSTLHRAAHPIFAEELVSSNGRIRRSNVMQQMRTIVNDPQAPDAGHLADLRELQAEYDRFDMVMQQMSQSSTTRAREMKESAKAEFQNWAELYVQSHPTVESYWLSILRPEAGLDG